MPFSSLEVLFEDNHLLVLNKPAELPTMGTTGGEATLLTLAKDYIKQKYRKPGNVYLGVVSRLDAPVTGIVLLARTSKAAARMTEQFRTRQIEKTYWALVAGRIEPAEGRYTDWLSQDERHRRMHVVGPSIPGAKEARLSYRRLGTLGGGQLRPEFRRPGLHLTEPELSLVEVELETGRKHQIRLQLAEHGFPIVGDRKYGSVLAFPLGIALHARRLAFAHPIGGAAIALEAPLPRAWPPLAALSASG